MNRMYLTILILSCLWMSGCTSVAPWERGTLAKPHMATDPHPLQMIMSAHNYSSREAAASTHAAGGGGCGCY